MLVPFGVYALCLGQAANVKTGYTKGKNKPYTSFSIMYEKDGDEKLYQNCVAWGDLSKKYLNRLDKGDTVLVFGTLEKDDYWSERNGTDEYKLTVSFAAVQELFNDDDVDEDLDLSDL